VTGYHGDPLEPRRENGRIHGRGAFDMKSGLAAAMVAAARAARLDLRGDVLVACVADEEHASWGTEEVLRRFSADAAIVVEPSHLELTLAHKGFAWFDAIVEGRAAHGSRPDLGIDAIAKAGHLLVAIEAWGERLRMGPGHPLLGHGSVHASVIQGGVEASSYPAGCRITIERRTLPGETADAIEAELAAIIGHLTTTVPDFHARIERRLVRRPFEADPDTSIARTVRHHAESVLGHPPDIRGEPFWTDCALLQGAGIPCVLFGVDGGGAHAATEWASESSIDALSSILHRILADLCR
jgi:acetylornithine deacetylase